MEHTAVVEGWRRLACLVLAALAMAVGVMAFGTQQAQAAQPFGPNTCASGFVWREAFAGDLVCVTPQARTTARNENAAGPANTAPGSQFCRSGFVWREARPSDLVCVVPAARSRVYTENYNAAVNLANPAAIGRTLPVSVGTRSDSLQRYITASGSSVSASGRVDFWGIGLVPGRLAWLGSATSNGNGAFGPVDIRSVRCPVDGPDSMSVVAVDQRTGRVTAAGSTWAYSC
ncbi:hypothetical protein ACVGOW_02640 [Pseudonocardia saturnea]